MAFGMVWNVSRQEFGKSRWCIIFVELSLYVLIVTHMKLYMYHD
jgi:hypothetical protein